MHGYTHWYLLIMMLLALVNLGAECALIGTEKVVKRDRARLVGLIIGWVLLALAFYHMPKIHWIPLGLHPWEVR